MCKKLFFTALLFGIVNCNNNTRKKTVDVTRTCPDVLWRVDHVDELWMKGEVDYLYNQSWWMRELECRMTFETGLDQGLCVDIMELDINTKGVTLEFLTNSYRPEKHYSNEMTSGEMWCTPNNMVTMVLKRPQMPWYPPPAAFRFVFQVRNKSLEEIEKVFNMGSPAYCDMHYVLKAEERGVIRSSVIQNSDSVPEVCEMTFTSLSTEEYGQVCVSVERFEPLPDCDMKLTLNGLDTSYWKEQVVYDCDTDKNLTREVCSMNKKMTIHLKRGKANYSANFELNIASKWMTYWESSENVKSELSFLAAAKSLTVLIATLDTAIALTAAFISIASRYPYGKLKFIADKFGKDPTVPHHYGNDYQVAIAVASGAESEPAPF